VSEVVVRPGGWGWLGQTRVEPATLVVLGALLTLGTTLAGMTVFFGWQTTVAVCLFGLTGLLLINNLRELSRD